MRRGAYGGPGDALDALNREVLAGERLGWSSGVRARDEPEDGEVASGDDEDDDDDDEDDDDDDDDWGAGPFAALVDDVPRSSGDVGTLLALALPLVLGASLALSYLATDQSSFGGGRGGGGGIEATVRDGLSRLPPALSTLSGAALCLLYVATEFRWAVPDGFGGGGGRGPFATTTTTTTTTTTAAKADSRRHPPLCAGNALAVAYVAGAYLAKAHPTLDVGPARLDLWPIQNGVNIALAASVSRALSPFLLSAATPPPPRAPSSSAAAAAASSAAAGKKSLRTVALALIGLALFDAVATFVTVANAAVDALPPISIMEAVARSKLASWQPGLLEVIIGHDNSKVTDALGLGDVVFPSVLVAWGFTADDADDAESVDGRGSSSIDNDFDGSDRGKSRGGGHPYASASVLGYLFGSFVTEIVGSFALLGTGSGLPALVFLIPSMLGAVTIMAWSRNELNDVWGVATASINEDS